MPLVPEGEFIPPALLPWPAVDLVPGMLGQEGAGKVKDELLKKGALG